MGGRSQCKLSLLPRTGVFPPLRLANRPANLCSEDKSSAERPPMLSGPASWLLTAAKITLATRVHPVWMRGLMRVDRFRNGL